ncbi:MAG: glycosyltransferase family 4 protein [Rhodospirillales bacterium]|nr:glycosyltransferase family 4 protein [Rhodospirillales bacterium]
MLLATLLALAAFLVSLAAVRGVMVLLVRQAIFDHPNERSSHSVPTPRGGGIGLMAAVLAGGLVLIGLGQAPRGLDAILILALALALLSWIDDRRGLSPLARFPVQIAAVIAGLFTFAAPPLLLGQAATGFDWVLAGIFWLWFVNLFNFMDGIDGIAGVETAAIALGAALIAILAGSSDGVMPLAMILMASAIGFLVWNWAPARIFLGDVGSIPLGFLLGWLLLRLAAGGAWAAALILPAAYLGDATLTLLRRLFRGEKIWQAHRSHFYQRAVQNGLDHAQVSLRFLIANLILIALAVLSLVHVWIALALAALAVAGLLVNLARAKAGS